VSLSASYSPPLLTGLPATVEALAPTLRHLYDLAARHSLDLRYNVYLSSPPNPLPSTPANLPSSTTLSPYRPEVSQLVREALPTPSSTANSESARRCRGGLAVIACGPEGIVLEAKNAVAGLGIDERVRSGGVEFHGECYAL
jgi:ferric-chelate reductase